MRGAVRPFFPGPRVIVNNDLKKRRMIGLGVEEGPLTEAEKRQFLAPPVIESVRRQQAGARLAKQKAEAEVVLPFLRKPRPPAGPRKPKYPGQRLTEKYRRRILYAKQHGNVRVMADGKKYRVGKSGSWTVEKKSRAASD